MIHVTVAVAVYGLVDCAVVCVRVGICVRVIRTTAEDIVIRVRACGGIVVRVVATAVDRSGVDVRIIVGVAIRVVRTTAEHIVIGVSVRTRRSIDVRI